MNKDQELLHAAQTNDWKQVKELVDAGAYVDFSDSSGRSALQRAVQAGELEIVKYLISKGADVN